MQDVAGCRLVVRTTAEQDVAVQMVPVVFEQCRVEDRRIRPSHGYRAVHLVVAVNRKRVEVQLRTELQHQWAEWSEKWADVLDPAIKYGGGPSGFRELLNGSSQSIADLEDLEREASTLQEKLQSFLSREVIAPALAAELEGKQEDIAVRIAAQKQEIANLIRDAEWRFMKTGGETE